MPAAEREPAPAGAPERHDRSALRSSRGTQRARARSRRRARPRRAARRRARRARRVSASSSCAAAYGRGVEHDDERRAPGLVEQPARARSRSRASAAIARSAAHPAPAQRARERRRRVRPGGPTISASMCRVTPAAPPHSRRMSPRAAIGSTRRHSSRARSRGLGSPPMALRIEDYALIGDTQTAALVGKRRLDRLALPAALRLAGVLRRAARRRVARPLAARARRRGPPHRAALPPGHARARDRLPHRRRRAAGRRLDADPRRGARRRARRALPGGPRRGADGARPALRLRPRRAVGAARRRRRA